MVVSAKKLSDWAKENGVHYRTAMVWLHEGTLPVPVVRTPGGHYRVVEKAPDQPASGKSVLYGRVSSHDQKNDLTRQMDRLRAFASGLGPIGCFQKQRCQNRYRLCNLVALVAFRGLVIESKFTIAASKSLHCCLSYPSVPTALLHNLCNNSWAISYSRLVMVF